MEKQIMNVEGMSCDHCINAITRAVTGIDGVESVDVNLKEETVTVEYDNIKTSLDMIKEKIEEQGYAIV